MRARIEVADRSIEIEMARPAEGREPEHRALTRFRQPTCRPSHGARHHRQRTARITETIFENRFMHAQELQRLGAQISIQGNTAGVKGVGPPAGRRPSWRTDLRASAGWSSRPGAEGQTVVDRIYHLDRRYEALEKKLAALAPGSSAPSEIAVKFRALSAPSGPFSFMAKISIALSKGRIFDETARCWSASVSGPRRTPTARASWCLPTNRRERAADRVRSLRHADLCRARGADPRRAGRDVLVEHGGEGLYQPVDLGIAACR